MSLVLGFLQFVVGVLVLSPLVNVLRSRHPPSISSDIPHESCVSLFCLCKTLICSSNGILALGQLGLGKFFAVLEPFKVCLKGFDSFLGSILYKMGSFEVVSEDSMGC